MWWTTSGQCPREMPSTTSTTCSRCARHATTARVPRRRLVRRRKLDLGRLLRRPHLHHIRMSTVEERTGFREEGMSRWIRANLPSSQRPSCFTCFDVDFVLRNYCTRRIAFVEMKCHQCKPGPGQELTMQLIDETMRLGTPARNEHYGIQSMAWTYCGYWLLQFENTKPDDGRIWLNGHELTEEQLRYHLGQIVAPTGPGSPSQK